MNQKELIETLMDMVPTMVAMSFSMKMISDAYKKDPGMFWSYFRKKNENIIFNCRM